MSRHLFSYSTWALMHEDTRRLAKLPDVVRDEITPVFIERCALHEGVFDRISKLDDTADYIKLNLTVSLNNSRLLQSSYKAANV